MEPLKAFEINFEYPLATQIKVHLTANVQLHHSDPYYVVSGFHLQQQKSNHHLLPDIHIKAIQTKESISWVHIDSGKETVLSNFAGKAIEAMGQVEISS